MTKKLLAIFSNSFRFSTAYRPFCALSRDINKIFGPSLIIEKSNEPTRMGIFLLFLLFSFYSLQLACQSSQGEDSEVDIQNVYPPVFFFACREEPSCERSLRSAVCANDKKGKKKHKRICNARIPTHENLLNVCSHAKC